MPTLLSTSKNKQNTQQNTHRARHSTPQENPPQSNAISGARIFYTGVFFPQCSGTPEHETEGKSGREGRGEKEKRRETLRIFFFVGGRAADERQLQMPSWTFMGDVLCSRQCALAPGMSASWARSKSPARQSETGFA